MRCNTNQFSRQASNVYFFPGVKKYLINLIISMGDESYHDHMLSWKCERVDVAVLILPLLYCLSHLKRIQFINDTEERQPGGSRGKSEGKW